MQNQQELQTILELEKNVCLITETRLTKKSFIKFKEYKEYQKIHPNIVVKGRRAVIIKESILQYQEIG